MIFELPPTDFARVQNLLQPLNYNLSLACLLAGKTPGRIFVDHPDQPSSALVVMKYHLFLAGNPVNQLFNQAVYEQIRASLIPEAEAAGRDAFLLHVASPAWQATLETILAGMYPLERQRQYYACTKLKEDWRPRLPDGFSLLAVNKELAAQTQLKNLDTLLEEMCSERPSVDDFLAQSFGFCLRRQDEIVSWCLSEYNANQRCEVGIATVEEYQRRGLGTITALALVEHALENGYKEIGWHCWTSNTASGALALKAGYDHITDYPVYLCIFDQGVQLATHGYDSAAAGNYAQALDWYNHSLTYPSAPWWVHYESARSHTKIGQSDLAIEHLRQGIACGFEGMKNARQDPDFAPLRDHPAWQELFPQ
jgi:RimJ/RimL family protein N-acetyltransferase